MVGDLALSPSIYLSIYRYRLNLLDRRIYADVGRKAERQDEALLIKDNI